ncbi:peptide deformylase [Chitiniphilus eburneus]|uniref:Peptide deformylase n=1 Tax=Chitiniphilus eburneus TaxID=2571148 RepID=A0A4U0Q903_9NEIS|nr:peptide deformylase [Chitiniphilus eburneus]TJZ77410.1 peptide deformylase [Chitiniphilus eburneus]
MAVREVLKMGDPRLYRIAEPVKAFATADLYELVTDLFDTMRAHQGVGIAAPQIGVNLQVVIFGFQRNSRYPEAPPVPETVLINPVLTPLSPEREEDWEGCLSVPGLRGRVIRHTALHYTGFDVEGRLIDRSVEGFHARVVQHECDHLNGILYPLRIDDLHKLGYTEVLFPDYTRRPQGEADTTSGQ